MIRYVEASTTTIAMVGGRYAMLRRCEHIQKRTRLTATASRLSRVSTSSLGGVRRLLQTEVVLQISPVPIRTVKHA